MGKQIFFNSNADAVNNVGGCDAIMTDAPNSEFDNAIIANGNTGRQPYNKYAFMTSEAIAKSHSADISDIISASRVVAPVVIEGDVASMLSNLLFNYATHSFAMNLFKDSKGKKERTAYEIHQTQLLKIKKIILMASWIRNESDLLGIRPWSLFGFDSLTNDHSLRVIANMRAGRARRAYLRDAIHYMPSLRVWGGNEWYTKKELQEETERMKTSLRLANGDYIYDFDEATVSEEDCK